MMRVCKCSLPAALMALILPALATSQGSVDDSTGVAPPDLPLFDLPPSPAEGYVWTPGYWAWSDDDQDFFWVPGTWVLAPQPELLWTPGYWEIIDVVYSWHPGYWGRSVGFYGGINYGFGYRGSGTGGRSSYNGGKGIQVRPTAAQLTASSERHIEATPEQRQLIQLARSRPALHVNQNQGQPPIAATPRIGVWSGPGVVGAKPRGTLSIVHQNAPAHADAARGETTTMEASRSSDEAPRTNSDVRELRTPVETHRAPERAPLRPSPPEQAAPRSSPAEKMPLRPAAQPPAPPEARANPPHAVEHAPEH